MAFIVVLVLTLNVHGLGQPVEVPDLGSGLVPLVVYQMVVLPRGPAPETLPLSMIVIVCEPEKVPERGEMLGAADWKLFTLLENVFPVIFGKLSNLIAPGYSFCMPKIFVPFARVTLHGELGDWRMLFWIEAEGDTP